MPLIKLQQVLLSLCQQILAQGFEVPNLTDQSCDIKFVLKLFLSKITHLFELFVLLGIEAGNVPF